MVRRPRAPDISSLKRRSGYRLRLLPQLGGFGFRSGCVHVSEQDFRVVAVVGNRVRVLDVERVATRRRTVAPARWCVLKNRRACCPRGGTRARARR